jgi:uncharacterized protein (DUF427 family)
MVKAHWNNVEIAASEDCVVVEGNQYFPLNDVQADFLRPSEKTSFCPWKGTASYYDVVVGDQVNHDAAWYYPSPKEAAAEIRDRVAFWRGVVVNES